MNKSPHQLAQDRIDLSEQYSVCAAKYAGYVKLQADHFNKFREEFKSDNATKRAWEATEEGVEMTILKLKMKSIEKKMTALNTMLRLLENEAKNLY